MHNAEASMAGENEFSRLFALGDLGQDGVTVEIFANNHELAALARRFDLVAVDSLAATVTLERDEAGRMIHVRGKFTADVAQSCVISLEPVANRVEGMVDVVFSTDESAAWAVRDMAPNADVAPDDDDLPEFLEGDEIDIGEVVAEHLGLQLDPYPRRPGVVFSVEDDAAADDEDPVKASPFAVLRDLKTN